MTQTPTNAPHMPTNFDPMAYAFVGAFDNQTGDPGARGHLPCEEYRMGDVLGSECPSDLADRTVMAFSPVGAGRNALRTLLDLSETSAYGRRGNQCDHCGAHLRYVAVLRHEPTGNHIAVGETCLDNRVGSMDRATWAIRQLREAAARQRAMDRNQKVYARWCENNAELADIFSKATDGGFSEDDFTQSTITDISRKVYQYGGITERQDAFVRKLAAEYPTKIARRQRIAAERAAEVRIPAPEGRQTFTGTVVAIKEQASDYSRTGYVIKLVVKCDGFVVWVSEPAAIRANKGDVVTMTAALTRSGRDESFAFGKRPTNASVIGHRDLYADEEGEDSLAPLGGAA